MTKKKQKQNKNTAIKVHRLIKYRRVKEATMVSKIMIIYYSLIDTLSTTQHVPILSNTTKYYQTCS